MVLKDIDIAELGTKYQISALVLSSKDENLVFIIPGQVTSSLPVKFVAMDSKDWEDAFEQLDNVWVEVEDRLGKTLMRKAQRMIDEHVKWKIFRRDEFKCRYCGADDVPLTMDHIVLWEKGGATIEKNLLTACKKCNKERGNMLYEDWIKSAHYKKVSAKLTEEELQRNEDVLKVIPTIVRVNLKRTR